MEPVEQDEMKRAYYRYIHMSLNGRREPRWRGVRVVKFPSDLILYAQVIQKRRPDFIIETGTAYGGSALFFADMLELTQAGGRVITIDIKPSAVGAYVAHPRVQYFNASSVDPAAVKYVKDETRGKRTMVVLDADHSKTHVLKEMALYAPIVTKGQYMVVEDCWTRHDTPYEPYYAVETFLNKRTDFKRYNLEKQFIFAVTRDGWLRKVK